MWAHQYGSCVVITFMSPTASVPVLRASASMYCGLAESPEPRVSSSTMVNMPCAPMAPGLAVVNGKGSQE
jgi:hypothetical protein